MSLLFALILICLPAAALIYDFYKGGSNTMLAPQFARTTASPAPAAPQAPAPTPTASPVRTAEANPVPPGSTTTPPPPGNANQI